MHTVQTGNSREYPRPEKGGVVEIKLHLALKFVYITLEPPEVGCCGCMSLETLWSAYSCCSRNQKHVVYSFKGILSCNFDFRKKCLWLNSQFGRKKEMQTVKLLQSQWGNEVNVVAEVCSFCSTSNTKMSCKKDCFPTTYTQCYEFWRDLQIA